uniref:Uncharacterized protein n=1 Tax=Aegilops tauschii subsp. strangulata TaxID=200361 RepID=A0A453SMB2_AEGTS
MEVVVHYCYPSYILFFFHISNLLLGFTGTPLTRRGSSNHCTVTLGRMSSTPNEAAYWSSTCVYTIKIKSGITA